MKQFNAVKLFILIALFSVSGPAIGQNWHPYAFDSANGMANANRYKDYVGQRVEVTNPSVIAGNKIYTISNNGSGAAGEWGGAITTPIVDRPVVMGLPDSSACSPLSNFAAMSGNIALIWRGPISGACEFGYKALQAQNAGAVACVLINEYPGEGPVGMGPGASGGSVTIPVIMIGNLDGIAMSAQYHSNPAGTVRMTITPWGQNYQKDLGFVPGGYSIWHDFAIPSIMLGGENPLAYRALDGAFVANFGSHNATNVKVKAGETFTPNGGSAGSTHWDSISLASFPAVDSIWAMFPTTEYDLTSISGPGRFDVAYTITSDSTDQFPFDNSLTYSYYATDSVFSKGRYDFVNNHVITSQYFRPGGNYLWGTPYYITQGGDAFKDVKFSIAGAIGPLPAQPQDFYIFKWVDGSFGPGSLDSAIEGGELQLVGTCSKQFNGTTDSSEGYFTTTLISSSLSDSLFSTLTVVPVKIDSNSWYYIAADIAPISSTQGMFLGCDGVLDMYPRVFGRKHFHNYMELYAPALDTDKADMRLYFQNAAFTSIVFGGASASIDSINYNSQIGIIPNLALEIMPYNVPVIDTDAAVKNTPGKADKFVVYPNPASDYVNVDLELVNLAKEVNYLIIDAHARVISRETHYNVQNDKFAYATTSLPSGNYFMVVTVDGRKSFKKFTVAR